MLLKVSILNLSRRLQSAGNDNEFWATSYNGELNNVRFGIYNSKTFSFDVLATFPSLRFSQSNMYVDKSEKKIFIAVNEDLIRLPLP